MKINLEEIINKHKGDTCVVALHGPSLNNDREKIESLQKRKKVKRISVNEWFDWFHEKPDYWVVSNSEFTIEASIKNDPLWIQRGYPHDVFNKYDIPLLYNCTADLSKNEFIEANLKCDYTPYDTKHFKNHKCREILRNFKNHYMENKNLNFLDYGNNSTMWQKPNVEGFPPWYKKIHGRIGGGFNIHNACCDNKLDITVQEVLQSRSGHEQHMSPGHTVGIVTINLAVLMGFSTIYVTGLDLDYSMGYSDPIKDIQYATVNPGNLGHWKTTYRKFLEDDMRILNESAELLGTKIINLNKEAWYNEFEKGDLEI
jgi:hypothetical protein